MNIDRDRQYLSFALLLASSTALLATGCDVRDEEARRGKGSPWPTEVVERLASPSQRGAESAVGNPTVDMVDGYAAGSRRAGESGLPMLLVFRAPWCRWSEAFLAHLPAEPRLAGLSGHFICVTIDADRDPATCRSFGVQAFPTAIVLDRERREAFRATGAAARAGLATAVESVLANPGQRIAGQSGARPR